MQPATDVVVVGGGLAGLTAAVTAARAGARVTLFDGRAVGGRARSAARDGFTLNEGAHALYRHGAGLATLRRLGVDPPGGAPDPATFRLVWDGETVPFPGGPRTLVTSPVLSNRSKVKLGGWYANLAGQARRSDGLTVREWFERERAGADLRRLTVALMRLSSYTADPEHASAPAMIRQLALGSRGVRYVDGGWQTIVDALADVASCSGVEIVDHDAVRSVRDDDGGWVVETSVRSTRAGAVVLACGGPPAATSLLGADPAGWAERAGPPQRAAVLDVGGHHPRHGFLLSADEPLYLSTHAPVARLAPPGSHLVTVMRYRTDGDPNDAAADRAALDEHAERAGLPPRGERTLDRFLAAPVVTWGTHLPGSPRPHGAELAGRGLWAAGDWVGEHHLADAAIASGAAAGAAAAGRRARAA